MLVGGELSFCQSDSFSFCMFITVEIFLALKFQSSDSEITCGAIHKFVDITYGEVVDTI